MISFGMWGVTNENTWKRMLEDFQIVSGDEGEGAAANLMQMRQRGAFAKPEFKGGFSIENSGRRQGCQVCSRGTEFVP